MKICTNCGEEKELTEFFNRRFVKDKKNSHCKECEKIQIQIWRKNNPEKNAAINRRGYLKHNYGITEEQYDELLDRQDRRCFICERHEREFTKRLCVDHNHTTGEIRGALCTYCNHRVVGQHKDGELLRKIANYIEQGTGWFVPKREKKTKKRKPNRGQ